GSALVVLCRVVGEQGHAAAGHSRLAEGQRVLARPLPEEVCADPEGDRKDHEPVLVDQPVRVEGVDELAAAVDQQVLSRLLLQLRDLLRDVSLQQGSVPGEWFPEGRGGYELGDRIHPHGELALGSSINGQAAAKPSKVTRPSSSASLAKSWSVWYSA